MKDVEIYAVGMVSLSVCSVLPPDETEKKVNEIYPTGISSQWQLSSDETFRTGEPNPCPCEQHPTTRKHYLMEC